MDKKIKVLEFSMQWSLGGTEKTAQILAENLNKEKFEVLMAGWTGGERVEILRGMGFEVYINDNRQEMIDWIKSKNIDIVHFHRMGDPDPDLTSTFKKAGIPIFIEHNIFAHFDNSQDRDLISKHIFVSRVQKEIYKQRSGSFFEEEKCDYLYNSTHIPDYEFKRDFSKPIFGRYSRKEPTKWHPINVHILPLVKSAIPDAKFHVMGLPDDYRDAIKSMGCEDMVVEFPNTINEKDLHEFLEGINVFTHGGVFGESFGCTIAESMASGIPVVTHTGGDSAQAELVTNEYNGYVVDPKDVRGYADAVIHLLKNPEIAKRMGILGRERAREWFNPKALAEKLEGILFEAYNKYKIKKSQEENNTTEVIEPDLMKGSFLCKNKRGVFALFKNDGLSTTIKDDGDYEPYFHTLSKKILKEGDVVIDAGANFGYHTIIMSKLVGNTGTVISFEPLRITFQQLCTNCFLNERRNVIANNAALSDFCGHLNMDVVDYNAPWMNVGATKVGTGGDLVQAVTLDAMDIDRLDFIKIDIQGSEMKLINGGIKTINKFRPIMIMEVEENWLKCFDTNSEELLNKVLSLNYMAIRIKADYPADHLLIPIEREGEIKEIIKDLPYELDFIKGKSVKLNWDRTDRVKDLVYGSFKVKE